MARLRLQLQLRRGGRQALYQVAGLSERERQVVELQHEGLTQRQVADSLGISLGAVKQLAHRGQRRLRSLACQPAAPR